MGFSDGNDDFVDDVGPEFDPELSPEPPELELEGETDGGIEIRWEEDQVRGYLVIQGDMTNGLLKLTDDDDTWQQTQQDLEAITPPLTRILNRYDASRAAAAAGDEILLAFASGNYVMRNYAKRKRILAMVEALGPKPVTGRPAPEGTGPEDVDEFGEPAPAGPHTTELRRPPALTPKGV